MNPPALTPSEAEMLRAIFRQHPEIEAVKLFGSRAKGIHRPNSDIDLAVWGRLNELQAEAIAAELDDLPLPYHFDVQSYDAINSPPLREHIKRVGILLYPETEAA
jgi:predicted nucleotidyltransferase